MRKILLSICLSLTAVIALAQLSSFSANGTYHAYQEITQSNDTVLVFVFNGINTFSTTITYNGSGTNFNWYSYSNPTSSISAQNYYTPDAGGYIFNVDGKKTSIWVINYQQYFPDPSRTVIYDNTPQCKTLNLTITPDIPVMTYQTPDNVPHTLSRNCNISYTTLSWNGTAWQDSTATVKVTLPATSPISVPVPYRSTVFTLKGDQFAHDLGIDSFKVQSTQYTPVAVICHMTNIVTSRYHLRNNEAQAPDVAQPINYSAPIEVQFLSNPNLPITTNYDWEFYKDNAAQSFISRSDQDTRYTFTEFGNYKVKVTVSNSSCSYSDSVTVQVTSSQIYAPNVFTPNGDGQNDEFRVEYESITSFHCWVYNRWGRLVYEWTDPTKGWDGNINGKKAIPGPYFYVIKALGSDFDPTSKPDSKTHRRVGEYLLKGDINLLR
ncbi:MAG: gliding motility-associated C-terminal domain-containing protein [Paludibacter sp.]|nr:gliding motility-associated C-terminal domain-containing protein [Paludibacter sp.]